MKTKSVLNALNFDNSSCNSKLKSTSLLCSKGLNQLWESAAAHCEWGYLKWKMPAWLPKGQIKWPKANIDVLGCLLNTQVKSEKTCTPWKFQDKREILNFYRLLQGTNHGDKRLIYTGWLDPKARGGNEGNERFLPLVSEHFRFGQKTYPLQFCTKLVFWGMFFRFWGFF